jgi:tetratricopeptide (TPR) repeat protein
VIELQKKLFGDDHITLAVTTACKGDVYERVGQIEQAIECFEEALRIKSATLGRHSIEVARILHKLGKLNAQNADFHVAESFISRAVLVYRLNKLPDDDEWLIDAGRDAADIDAAITMGKTGVVDNVFEC